MDAFVFGNLWVEIWLRFHNKRFKQARVKLCQAQNTIGRFSGTSPGCGRLDRGIFQT